MIQTAVVNSVVNIAANWEAQSSPAGRRFAAILPESRTGKAGCLPRREHEADGTSFERDAEFCDPELLALDLRSGLRSAIYINKLDQCFADQVGIAEI